MKKTILSLLCLALILALMLGANYGVNNLTAPIVEARAQAALGDAVVLYDSADPAASELAVTADTVKSIYRDDVKQVFTIDLSTSEGYSHGPIDLKLTVDFEGRIAGLELVQNSDDKDLGEAFLPSFAGQDSALAGVELVAGVTFSSSAIRNAVADGMNALAENELITAGQKDADQLLAELIPSVYPGLVNKAGAIQGEELEGAGSVTKGYVAANGSGSAWFVKSGDADLLGVVTRISGPMLFDLEGNPVEDSALFNELAALAGPVAADLDGAQQKALAKLLPEGAELQPMQIPGIVSSVTGAYAVETEEGTLYAFAARPYGYANEVMELYYVLDEHGAIVAMRAKELILHSDYFSNYTLDNTAYREGFLGLTADEYTGEEALISGATMSSDAVDTATRDVFEAFRLATAN